jgi:hypothetical protein
VRRRCRWRMFSGMLLSIMGMFSPSLMLPVRLRSKLCRKVSWATYTTVRYFVAYAIYSGSGRRAAALSLGIASSLSFLFAATLAVSSVLPCHVALHRPRLRLLHRVLPFLVSFFLFAPTVVNLVLVLVWRNARSSNLTLRGRCHWSPDVVWVGVGGQCADHAPAFGVWLTAAILRLVLTASILVGRVVVYSQDHCVNLMFFRVSRSPITSRHRFIARYSGHRAIIPMTSAEWTLSIYPMPLPDHPPPCILSSIKVGLSPPRSVLYPALGWQPYPSSVMPSIGIHKTILAVIQATVAQHLRKT